MSLAQPCGAGKHLQLDIMQSMIFFDYARWRMVALAAILLLTGCRQTEPTAPKPVLPLSLTAYATQTLSVHPGLVLSTPPVVSSVAALPPTPSAYTIQQGDTLLEIAQRFGVSLAEVLAANPGIRPESLSVGQVIQIPVARSPQVLPTPTVDLGEPVCFPSASGLYCFVPVHSPGERWLENVKVQITLLNAEGRPVMSQEALTPLTGLGAGQTLPAVAFFPKVQSFSAMQTQLLSAVQTDGMGYLPAEIKNLLVSIAWGGLSAQMDGQIWLPGDAEPARQITLAGVAYDRNGNLVGVRRWEWSGSLAPGERLPFVFSVYSAGAPIGRVEVLVEARP